MLGIQAAMEAALKAEADAKQVNAVHLGLTTLQNLPACFATYAMRALLCVGSSPCPM